MTAKVCFIGGARYSRPLDASSEKKFKAMKALAEVFVIGFSRDLRLQKFTQDAHFYLLPQLPLPMMRYLELLILGFALTVWLVARHRIGVVVAQSPYEGFVAALAIKFIGWCGYRMGLVVEVHGDFERSLFLYRRIRCRSIYQFVMNRIAGFAIAQADVLRAVSNSTVEQLRLWAPRKTIVQFPAWTDIEAFLYSPKTLKTVSESVVYAGVLSPVKGIQYLINAFSIVAGQYPKAELFIIGKDENPGYAADLHSRVRELGLTDRVHFFTPLPQRELALWMGRASVFVLPSLTEGLPRVILEAMATGTPVIGSSVGGIPELVEEGTRGFLIPPGDERLLADKLRWIFDNPDKARVMGECGRSFAEQCFSTERYVKGYRQILRMSAPTFEQRGNATSTL
jgi:glycosyltransferase involved in cell wall biosynthesis